MSRDYFGHRPTTTRGIPSFPTPKKGKGLGDMIEAALKAVGLHQAVKAIERATGRDCGCAERKRRANEIRLSD